jgi:hypothetical protein
MCRDNPLYIAVCAMVTQKERKRIMRLWRVMHPLTGKGPYNDGTEDGFFMGMRHSGNIMHGDPRRPGPEEDGLDSSRHRDKIYAFTSLEQARSWFGEDTTELAERGYQLASVETGPLPAEQTGGHQCVAPREVFSNPQWHDIRLLAS